MGGGREGVWYGAEYDLRRSKSCRGGDATVDPSFFKLLAPTDLAPMYSMNIEAAVHGRACS